VLDVEQSAQHRTGLHLAQSEHPLVYRAAVVGLGVEVLRVLTMDVGEHGRLEAVRLRLQQREGGGVELLAVEQLQLEGERLLPQRHHRAARCHHERAVGPGQEPLGCPRDARAVCD